MAKYFKYKTPEDVVADSERLGCPIEVSDNFKVLYEPIQIGHLQAKSRLGIQPMEGCDGTTDGFPDELTYRRYRRFGAGGASLIW
ncbi:MAG: NADH:flavin oxidoreductase, partial [Gimesia chilikensis]